MKPIAVLMTALILAGCTSAPAEVVPATRPAAAERGPYGKEQICAKVNGAIQTGGTVRWVDLLVAEEAWEEQVCPLPEVSVSHGERQDACRHYVEESTVGSAGTRELRTPDLQEEVHPRAWVLASTGGFNGVRCRIGSWEYGF
jgi:hypothetical protein